MHKMEFPDTDGSITFLDIKCLPNKDHSIEQHPHWLVFGLKSNHPISALKSQQSMP